MIKNTISFVDYNLQTSSMTRYIREYETIFWITVARFSSVFSSYGSRNRKG